MSKKIGVWLVENRWIAIGIEVFITIFFLWKMQYLELGSRLSDLLPANHPYIKVHHQYEKQLGDPFKVYLMLKVKKGVIYNLETLKKIQDITYKLDMIPGVNHEDVYSIASRKVKKVKVEADALFTENLMNGVPTTKKEIENLQEEARYAPGVFGVWVSKDEKAVLFTAGFISGLVNYDVVFKKVEEIIRSGNDDNHIVYAAGEPLLKGWINFYHRQTYLIFGLTCLGFLGLLYYYFRNLLGVLVHIPPIILGVIWYLGFCGWMGFNIEPLTLVIPMLITARSLSHSVQFTERYFEIYEEVKDVKEACILTTASILPPGALGIAADGAGILLLAVAPIPIMQKLAYGCGFWALSILLSGQMFTPVLISFFPPPKNIESIIDKEKGMTQKILGLIGRSAYGKAGVITFAVGVVLYLFTGWGAFKVDIGDIHPGTPILWPKSFYNLSIDQINKKFPGTEELYVILEGNRPTAVENYQFLTMLGLFQEYMENNPKVSQTFSIGDFLPNINKNVGGGYYKLDTNVASKKGTGTLFYLLKANSAPSDFDHYLSHDNKDANIIIWVKDHTGETIRDTINSVKKFIEENKKLITETGVKFKLASGSVGLLAALNETIVESQLLNAVLVIGAVFLMCAFVYRSFIAALILMIPLNLANCMTITIMNWLGIGLNVNTLPVVSVGVGVGIDYGIYLLTRICEETQVAQGFSSSVVNTALKTTGKAIFFTATSMIFGVIFWYFLSSLRFQAEMGLLLAIIMFLNMILALLLIPTIVFIFKPKFLTLTKGLVRN